MVYPVTTAQYLLWIHCIFYLYVDDGIYAVSIDYILILLIFKFSDAWESDWSVSHSRLYLRWIPALAQTFAR